MKILALDLSKFKSVGCVYEAESGEHRYRRREKRAGRLRRVLVGVEGAGAGTEVLESRGVCGVGGDVPQLGGSRDLRTMAWRAAVRDATVAGYPGAHPRSRSEAGRAGEGRRSGGPAANDPGGGTTAGRSDGGAD